MRREKGGRWRVLYENYRYFVGKIWRACWQRVAGHLGVSALRAAAEYVGGIWLLRQVIVMLDDPGIPFRDYLLLVALVFLLQLTYSVCRAYYSAYSSRILDQRVLVRLKLDMFRQARQVDFGCFEDAAFYDRYQRASGNLNKLVGQVMANLSQLVSCAVTMAATLGLIVESDPGGLCFAVCPFIALFFFTRSNEAAYEQYKALALPTRRMEYIRRVLFSREAAKDIKSSGILGVLERQMYEALEASCRVIGRFGRLIAGNQTAAEFFYVTAPLAGGIVYATVRLLGGAIRIGEFAVFSSAIVSFNTRLSKVMKALETAHGYGLQIQDFRQFLERPASIRSGKLPCEELQSIQFSHVSFRYPNGKEALHDCCLTLRRGETTALVGLNGAGKTTIIKLLLRLYDPTEGVILVNGRDLKDYDLASYRGAFGVAFQDYRLFSLSIGDNVVEGEYTGEDAAVVEQALRAAGLWELVSAMPHGVETMLTRTFSTEGVELSGGQSQKLMLSRIFAKCLRGEAMAMILDEPTAALDPQAEYQMFCSLMEMGKDRLCLLITHRLSSTVHAGNIYLIENGTVVESGGHDQLMAQGGRYAALFLSQAKMYREKEARENGR